jgi:hypothetical protein
LKKTSYLLNTNFFCASFLPHAGNKKELKSPTINIGGEHSYKGLFTYTIINRSTKRETTTRAKELAAPAGHTQL